MVSYKPFKLTLQTKPPSRILPMTLSLWRTQRKRQVSLNCHSQPLTPKQLQTILFPSDPDTDPTDNHQSDLPISRTNSPPAKPISWLRAWIHLFLLQEKKSLCQLLPHLCFHYVRKPCFTTLSIYLSKLCLCNSATWLSKCWWLSWSWWFLFWIWWCSNHQYDWGTDQLLELSYITKIYQPTVMLTPSTPVLISLGGFFLVLCTLATHSFPCHSPQCSEQHTDFRHYL